MPTEEIDRTSLSIDGERDFDERLPAASFQVPRDSTDKQGVALVEQAIELSTAPSDDMRKVSIEGREDTGDAGHCQVVGLAALKARDLALADARPLRHVDLAPTKAMSESSGDAAETKVAHAVIVEPSAHPPFDWLDPVRAS